MQPSAIQWIIWLTVHSCQVLSQETIGQCPHSCTCVQFIYGQNITCCQQGNIDIDTLHLRQSAYSLNLSECQITHIPEGVFANATNLTILIIRNGRFTELKRNSFIGLRNLRQLDLNNGSLRKVETGAFGILKSLKKLSLIGNSALPLTMLPAIFHNISLHNTLEEICIAYINGLRFSTGYSIEKDYLRGLKGLNIRLFTFVMNHISEFNATNFAYMGNIQCFSFRQNSITLLVIRDVFKILPILMSSNIVVMDFMHQIPIAEDVNIASIAEICEEALSDTSVLSCPRISSSATRTFIKNNPDFTGLSLPPKMQRLNLGYTGTKSIVKSTIFYDNNVTHLNFEGNLWMHVEGSVVGLTCLRFLTFARTRLSFTNITSFLRYFPSLEYLNMSTTCIGSQLESGNFVFDNATNLKAFDLSYNELQSADAINYSSLYPHLKFLYLHNNKFRSIPLILSAGLKLLDFQQNQLTTISEDDRSHLQTLFQKNPNVKLRLAGNPFDCQCSRETYAFIEWIQRNKGHISDLDAVVCTIASPNGIVLKKISEISVLKFRSTCDRDIIIGILGPLIAILVVTISAIIVYKKQWVLKYKWFRLQIRIRVWNTASRTEESEEEIPLDEYNEGNDKVYIIFRIEEDTEDYMFVYNDLTEMLLQENIEPIYHLTTRRYFLGNRPETLDIVDAMEKCIYCIIVLSPRLIHKCSSSEETFEAINDRRLVRLSMFAIHMAPMTCNVTTILFKQPSPSKWIDDDFLKYLKLLRIANLFLEWYDDRLSQQVTKEKLLNILTAR